MCRGSCGQLLTAGPRAPSEGSIAPTAGPTFCFIFWFLFSMSYTGIIDPPPSPLALPALSIAAACSRRQSGGYRGYAFIATEEGQALAAGTWK